MMIRGVIDPPQKLVTLTRTDQLVDHFGNHFVNILCHHSRCPEHKSPFQRRLYSRSSGSSRFYDVAAIVLLSISNHWPKFILLEVVPPTHPGCTVVLHELCAGTRHDKKQKCGCAQMPGDTTFKSPHHEEYSSSDIQHTFPHKFFSHRNPAHICFIEFSLLLMLWVVPASNIDHCKRRSFAGRRAADCAKSCGKGPDHVVVGRVLWEPAQK